MTTYDARTETLRYTETVRELVAEAAELYDDALTLVHQNGVAERYPEAVVAFTTARDATRDPSADWNFGDVSQSDRPDYFQHLADFAVLQTQLLNVFGSLIRTLSTPPNPGWQAWGEIIPRVTKLRDVFATTIPQCQHLAAAFAAAIPST